MAIGEVILSDELRRLLQRTNLATRLAGLHQRYVGVIIRILNLHVFGWMGMELHLPHACEERNLLPRPRTDVARPPIWHVHLVDAYALTH